MLTSASRNQSRSSRFIRGSIPWNSTELPEAVPIGSFKSYLIVIPNDRFSCDLAPFGLEFHL